jgi:hypothetical protein
VAFGGLGRVRAVTVVGSVVVDAAKSDAPPVCEGVLFEGVLLNDPESDDDGESPVLA